MILVITFVATTLSSNHMHMYVVNTNVYQPFHANTLLSTTSIVDLTIVQCIESFPCSTLSKQEGKPACKKIKLMHKNEVSIKTARRGDLHRYLAIVLDPIACHTLIRQTFMSPINSGPVPIAAGITRAAAIASQKSLQRIFA